MNSAMPGEPLLYVDGDTELHGEIYHPTGEANGCAVAVFHEADGIGGNVRRHCAMLAKLGYVALAADMHGGGRVLEGGEMLKAMDSFRADPDRLRRRAISAYHALLEHGGIDASHSAAIGFCFGGFTALELARSGVPLAAVASFHGLLTTKRPARTGEVHTKIAVFTGARDPLVPFDDIAAFQAEMTEAEAEWQLTIYGQALHSFTNKDVDALGDARMRYDRSAHVQSWSAMIQFLATALGIDARQAD